MKIIAIDTSCDETAVAVTQGTTVISNVIWSQAAAHADFGGVMPSLAQRLHRERIDWTVEQAMRRSQCTMKDIEAIAVTAGPGLAIALEVGIIKAKEIAGNHCLPLIPINHIEGHLLSPLAKPNSPLNPLLNPEEGNRGGVTFPAFGLVVSGGHTELILVNNIGDYRILAQTQDDALGEALDKAARMLGLGYPGGAVLEKMARQGNAKAYSLPLPMARSGKKDVFSYSGLKTAFYRLIDNLSQNSDLNKTQICDLAASFQNRAFQHLERVITQTINTSIDPMSPLFSAPDGKRMEIKNLLVGGGVAANIELRRWLRKMGKGLGLNVRLPYSARLIGDNAAMIGVAAYFQIKNHKIPIPIEQIDRRPRWGVEEVGV